MSKLNAEAMQARINDLIETGKAKGVLTYNEIIDTLGETELVSEHFDKILDTLAGIGIEIVKDEPMEEPEPEPAQSASVVPEETPYTSPIDFEALKAENPDIYGWLEIPNTDISYPLLQSATDDTFYLDHDRDGNFNVYGSLFTEHECNGTDFTDRVTPIYGHHMKSGAMFGNLQQIYSDEETYNASKEVIVYLPEREIHYTVFAAVAFDDRHLMYSYDFQTEDGVQQFLDDLAAVRAIGSSYDESVGATSADHLIVLSTCLKGGGNGRFLVVAREDTV